MLSGIPQKRKR
uniref:UMP/CMP kinase n=1 Tax=Rhizophora mucronata TaxID=61149 RepID=A0A2P2L853_RHIMU